MNTSKNWLYKHYCGRIVEIPKINSWLFQVIPAKGNSSAKISFYPFTNDSSGELCTAYAAAYMSLDDQVCDTDHLECYIALDVYSLNK